MKVTSEQFKTKAENQYGTVYQIKALVDGIEITDEIQDFECSAMTNPDGEFAFGNTCASQISFKIDTPSQNLTDREITIQQGIDIDGVVEYVNIGVFKVLKPENTRSVYTYQCVDRMVSRMEMPYFSELTYPTTDINILEEICSQVNISLDSADSLIPHTLQSAPSGYTRREVIGYMAQLQGKNAIINGNGNLELKWYNNVNYTIDDDRIYLDGSDSIKDETNYILGYIECSVSTSSDEEIKTIKSGTGNIGIKTENPFMTQEILDEVFSVIGGFSFMPVEVQFLGDFRLEVGDIVTVETYGKTYQVPIMQLTHSSDGGVVTTIESVAETDSENEISFTNPITKQMERYYAELVLINKALVNKLGVEQLDAVKAEITTLVVGEIDGRYAQIDFANIDTAKVDKNIVSLLLAEVGLIDRATIVEGHVTKLLDAVEINANSITTGTLTTDRLVIRGTDKSIVYELNNIDGALQTVDVDTLNGEIITDRTINADKIIANSITANEIDVEDIFAQDITATGTIRGAKFVGGNLKSENFTTDGSKVTSGMYIDLESGSIASTNMNLGDGFAELHTIYNVRDLHSDIYYYDHYTHGKVGRSWGLTIDSNPENVLNITEIIENDGKYLSNTNIGAGTFIISNLNGHNMSFGSDSGLYVQAPVQIDEPTQLLSTLDVTGATTLGQLTVDSINNYVLGNACAKNAIAEVKENSTDLVTSGAVYSKIANLDVIHDLGGARAYTSEMAAGTAMAISNATSSKLIYVQLRALITLQIGSVVNVYSVYNHSGSGFQVAPVVLNQSSNHGTVFVNSSGQLCISNGNANNVLRVFVIYV